jgi:nucleotide-binding universal stress UspA family protein
MNTQLQNIVVAVESPRGRDPVLRRAIELAAETGATLHVVHGFMLADPLLDAYARAGYLGPSAVADVALALERGLEAQVEQVGSTADVHVHVVAGPPANAILDVAQEMDADLIVLGPSRHDRFPLSLLGNTVRTVLRQALAPVLIMREGVPVLPGRLLVATDLSQVSRAAMEAGIRFPRAAGAVASPVRVLLVIDESLLLLPLEQRLLERVAEQELEAFTNRSELEGREIETVVRKGEPAAEILAEAKESASDLIVLGSSGRRGMERLLVGSVAEATLRNAPCNVLVLPAAALVQHAAPMAGPPALEPMAGPPALEPMAGPPAPELEPAVPRPAA